VGRDGLNVASVPRLGQHHIDPAPVAFAAAPLDRAVPGQPVDQPGQRALAQVDGFGQVLTSSRVLRDDDRGWTPQLWGILFVLGGALCLDAPDVSMVGVALPSIRSALG
jgi:hypothetical protein